MLNSNILMFLAAMLILLLVGIAWYFYLNNYDKGKNSEAKRREQVLSLVKLDKKIAVNDVLCPVELPNTDEDVADALVYIKAADIAGGLLEKLYEQAGI